MIKFGFKRLEKQEEQYLFDFPYLEVDVKPTELRKVAKFRLIQARDLLKFNIRENRLSWLFTEDESAFEGAMPNTFYLINVSSVNPGEVSPEIKVNLDLDFNSKPLYEKMERLMGFDPTVKNYFKLVKADDIEGFPTVTLEPIIGAIQPLDEMSERVNDVADATLESVI